MIRSGLDLVPTVILHEELEADALAAKQRRLARLENRQTVTIKRYDIPGVPATHERNLDDRVFLVFRPSVAYTNPPDALVSDVVPSTLQQKSRRGGGDDGDDDGDHDHPKDVVERVMYSGHYCSPTEKENGGVDTERYNTPTEVLSRLQRGTTDHNAPFVSLPISDGLDSSSSNFFVLSRIRSENMAGPGPSTLTNILTMSFLSSSPHTLREERVGGAKTGRSISTAWQSDFDVKKVNFRKNYIDRDDDDVTGGGDLDSGNGEGGDDGSGKRERRSRGKKTTSLLEIYKKQRLEAGDDEDDASEHEGEKEEDEEGKKARKPNRVLPSSSSSFSSVVGPVKEPKSVASINGASSSSSSSSASTHPNSSTSHNELTAHTIAAVSAWKQKNVPHVKLTDATKDILKGLSEYQDMKAKHMNPQTKPVAAEWFRVSQLRVRHELTQAGCTIDTNGLIIIP